MNTERLYYSDSYLTSFDANVIAAEGCRVYLDRTAFYPTSGGQPHDSGVLNSVRIVDVVDEEHRIAHVLERPITEPTVTGTVDWPRRYDHMQQHTGQHLLSAVFQEALGLATVSFHMGAETSTIDLAVKELTDAQMSDIENRVNEVARTPASVDIVFEEAQTAQGLRKASDRTGVLRIIDIPGWDRSACGGTHVKQLFEVLPVQLRGTEKIRGNTRLEFACGTRATRLARRDFHTLAQLARLAGTSPTQTFDHFSTLRQRLTEAEKDRQRLVNQIAEREGLDLYASTAESPDSIRRCRLQVERIDEAQRKKANTFAAQSKAICLLTSPDGVLLACSGDSGFNASAIWKQTVASHGGSGGGSPQLVQGKLANSDGVSALANGAGF